jgi:hypothetical protein
VNEIKFSALTRPKNILFGADVDYFKFIDLVRQNPQVQEISISSTNQLNELLFNERKSFIPILLRRADKIELITVDFEYEFQEGDALAYIGEEQPAVLNN